MNISTYLRNRFIFACLPLLFACSTKVSIVNEGVDLDSINVDASYVLVGFDSKIDLKSISLSGPKNYVMTDAQVLRGDNFLLFPVVPGEYVLDRVQINNYFSVSLDESKWQINIAPKKINYIGHIEVFQNTNLYFGAPIELANRTSQAIEYLEDKHAKFYQSVGVVYSGPGYDHFIEFISE